MLAISPNKQMLQMWAHAYLTTRTYGRVHLDSSRATTNFPATSLLPAGDIPLWYRHILQSKHIKNNNFIAKQFYFMYFYVHLTYIPHVSVMVKPQWQYVK